MVSNIVFTIKNMDFGVGGILYEIAVSLFTSLLMVIEIAILSVAFQKLWKWKFKSQMPI